MYKHDTLNREKGTEEIQSQTLSQTKTGPWEINKRNAVIYLSLL